MAAARTKSLAGALDAALLLLDIATTGRLDSGEQARADLLHAQIAYSQHPQQRVGDAHGAHRAASSADGGPGPRQGCETMAAR